MGRPGQAVQDSSSSSRTTLSSWARLAAALGGLLRRRSSEVSMLSGSPGPAEAAAARAQKRKFDSRCSGAHCKIEVQVWPSCLVPGSCRVLSPGPRQHRNTAKRRRRAQPRPDGRRPQRGGEHNHDPTTTTCNIPVPGPRCRRQGG